MKAIVISRAGGLEVLQLEEVEIPVLKDDHVLIRVAATALNQADVEQRKGVYPPPKGASPFPGLECSGTVEAVGKNASRWRTGDQVPLIIQMNLFFFYRNSNEVVESPEIWIYLVLHLLMTLRFL